MKNFLKWFGFGLVVLVIMVWLLISLNSILPEGWKLTAEIIVGLAAFSLSIAFKFLPGIRVAFAGIGSGMKAFINLVLVLVMAIVMYLGVCVQLFQIPGIACDMASIKVLAVYIFTGAVCNQVTYVATKKPIDVIEAEMARDSGQR